MYNCIIAGLVTRHKLNSGRAVLVAPVQASVTVYTRNERTATRWWHQTSPRSSGQTLPAPFCHWRQWASMTCCRLTSWTHRRCRRSSLRWSSCMVWVHLMMRDCLHGLAEGFVSFCVTCFIFVTVTMDRSDDGYSSSRFRSAIAKGRHS